MKKHDPLFLLFLLFFLVPGCSHVISKELRASSDLSLTLKQVRENPGAYKGKSVVWGGEIIRVINQGDGTTEIEVFQEPLGFRGEPTENAPSEGRFLVLNDRFLDPYIYQEGRKITVAGKLQGEKVEPLSEMYYRYPVIASEQIYLWPEYYPYPYPYYWGYDDSWWGYPYGWWGFGYYYHHHHHHHYSSPHYNRRAHRELFENRGPSGGEREGSGSPGGVGRKGHK